MARSCQILVLFCLFLGCSGPPETQPIWKQTQIGDLAPARKTKNTKIKPPAVTLKVYVFEIPAEKTAAFANVWNMLRTDPLRFENRKIFRSNLFLAGFGREEMWLGVRNILKIAQSKRANKISFALPDGRCEDIFVAQIYERKDLYHVSKSDRLEGKNLGPGSIVFRVKAERIPASKGVFQIRITPFFVPALETSRQFDEFKFSNVGLRLKMSPGDFVLIGPEKYADHHLTLGSLSFSLPGPKPVIKAYLLTCASIED
ncbi:MAG: hypothetical protein ACYSSI_11515 [Planctomycetota bacterium]|jgi:hypothetical protein